MSLNQELSLHCLRMLGNLGVREFCICPGGRNAPLVEALQNSKGLKVYSFYDERSAAFFALGRIKAERFPVAVITTSGTAVAESLSAVIEAYYSGLPLVVVTADRPKSYRGSGSPQSIEQVDIFGRYVQSCLDWDQPQAWIETFLPSLPLHINLCFDEPLTDNSDRGLEFSVRLKQNRFAERIDSSPVADFLTANRKPLVVVGELTRQQRKPVESFLLKLGAPFYSEIGSGLDPNELSHCRLCSGDSLLSRLANSGLVNGVIRLGQVPTIRLWRDLQKSELPVLSLSEQSFGGLARQAKALPISILEKLDVANSDWMDSELSEWQDRDRKALAELDRLVNQFPLSEVAWMDRLNRALQQESRVYVGNSQPIRNWDLVNQICWRPRDFAANRGANGIDGQISTFLAWCMPSVKNVGIFGDLTAMYDFSAPWVLPQLPGKNINIVVINNRGGRIFSRMFASSAFLNEHQYTFEKWAGFWELEYYNPRQDLNIMDIDQRALVEINPELSQSQEFWHNYTGMKI